MVPILQAIKDFFGKKQVWMAFALLAFLFLKSFWPAAPLTEENIQVIVIALAMGIFGIQFSDNNLLLLITKGEYAVKVTTASFLEALANFFANKQVWIYLGLILFLLLKSFWPDMPLTEGVIQTIVISIATGLFGIQFIENIYAKREVKAVFLMARLRRDGVPSTREWKENKKLKG